MRLRLTKKLKKVSFQHKLIEVCLFCGLIPLCILGCFSSFQQKNALEQHERTILSDMLSQECQRFESSMGGYDNLLYIMAWDESIRSTFMTDYHNNSEMLAAYRDVIMPKIVTAKIMIKAISRITYYTDIRINERTDVVMSLDKYLKKPEAETVLSNNAEYVFFHPEENEIVFCQRIYYSPIDIKSSNSSVTVVELAVDYEEFFSSFTDVFSDDYGVVISDDEGEVIFSYQRGPIREVQDISDLESMNTCMVETRSNVYGRYSFSLIRSRQPIREAIKRMIFVTAVIAVMSFVLVFVLSILLSKTLVLPLRALTKSMKRVEKDDLSGYVEIDREDEIGAVIRVYNGMLKRLNYLIHAVMESRIKQKEYELKALQAQINPHFLYNSLSLINSRAIIAGEDEIQKMAQYLALFYRTTLNKGKSITTVASEIDNIQAYINIQLIMHDYSFDVVCEIDESIRQEKMLNLLLQPIVENAILHGIDQKTTEKRGRLQLRGTREGNELVFTVFDNGMGIPEDIRETLFSEESPSYGLKNVRERIRLFYGEEFGLELDENVAEGTCVKVRISVIDQEETAAEE